ncbi:MAG: Na+/H+ antiporter subunit E [Gammaproteobacteria bacterium]|nr:Na+/H+ antiporter subunit E [Gammaproteobacteria bacterium]
MKRQTLRKLMVLRRRVLPSLPQSFTVFLFWLLMAEDFDPGNVIMALLLAVVMPLIATRLEREFARMARLDVFLMLGGLLLWDLVKANFTVARQVLGAERKLTPHFIWIPLELTNIHGISALAAVITLTPGTVAAALTEDRKHMLVHVLSTDDPQGMIEEIKQRYEIPLRQVFP